MTIKKIASSLLTLKSYCRICLRETNQKELFSKRLGEHHHDNYWWTENYRVLQCLGCDKISFRIETINQDSDFHTEELDYIPYIYTYPSYLTGRNELSDIHLLPLNVRTVYTESINALKNECNILAAAGLRAVIEAVCMDKNVTGRDIANKIDKLHSNGFLSKTDKNKLHAVRFLGNDSLHELSVPEYYSLDAALTIIEHLLNTIYIIDGTIRKRITTIIENYKDFASLLTLDLIPFEIGEVLSIKEILKKNYRRCYNNIEEFESSLQKDIAEGHFKLLSYEGPREESNKTTHYYKVIKESALKNRMKQAKSMLERIHINPHLNP